jgi:hypothetical protein
MPDRDSPHAPAASTSPQAHRAARMLRPQTALVAAGPFGPAIAAPRVASAIGRGLQSAGSPSPDLCAIEPVAAHDAAAARRALHELLAALEFDERMLRSRAVVLAAPRLAQDTLREGFVFETATRARQAGVPAYAIAGENRLSLFDARVLDLQTILTATTTRALSGAGRRLATMI